jgi:hypothetical protein
VRSPTTSQTLRNAASIPLYNRAMDMEIRFSSSVGYG